MSLVMIGKQQKTYSKRALIEFDDEGMRNAILHLLLIVDLLISLVKV